MANSPSHWPSQLQVDRVTALHMAVAVVEIILPEWRANCASDTAPLRAIKAALANPSGADKNLRLHAQAVAKACTASRQRTLGYEHRIAEAARAVANASAATNDEAALQAVGEAFEKTEEQLNYRLLGAQFKGKELAVRELEARERILRCIVAASEDADR